MYSKIESEIRERIKHALRERYGDKPPDTIRGDVEVLFEQPERFRFIYARGEILVGAYNVSVANGANHDGVRVTLET